ncbi:bZIP transcription factor [Nonomuraea cavernae]|uniref:bZIP transcription factor n=1 Tax=Nonomuraea cavernae TaxID=2045107 RepID=UPI0033DF397C
MSLTIPAEYATVAGLIGGGVAALFTLDEDHLREVGHTLGVFARQATPSLAGAEQAATVFTSATSGATRDEFAGHWNTLASEGHTGRLVRIANWGSTALGAIAQAIELAKMGVLAWLGWSTAQLAIAAFTGVGVIAAATSALLRARTSIGSITTKLFTHLRGTVAQTIRRASDQLKDILNKLPNLGPKPRLALAGHGPTPSATPKGGTRLSSSWASPGKRKAADEAMQRRRAAQESIKRLGKEIEDLEQQNHQFRQAIRSLKREIQGMREENAELILRIRDPHMSVWSAKSYGELLDRQTKLSQSHQREISSLEKAINANLVSIGSKRIAQTTERRNL